MRPVCFHPSRFKLQSGVTLVELMISMTIGLFIIAVATAVLVTAKSGYIAQTDSAQVLDTGRHAIDILVRTLRQASYLKWDAVDTGEFHADEAPAIFGMDAMSLTGRTEGVSSPMAGSPDGSDVLAVRFAGSGQGSNGDGSVLNCAGFGVGTGDGVTGGERGWSIFYVALDASGEPELYCKYSGEDGWAAQAIARGVESFQVLYGLDSDSDGYPNSLVNASEIESMPTAAGDRNEHWRSIVQVKVAVLVRGAHTLRSVTPGRHYDLFGESYSTAHGGRDRGVRINESDLPASVRNRSRKVFTATIWLRNRPAAT